MARFMAELISNGPLALAAAQSAAAQPPRVAPGATAPATPKVPAARATAPGGALLEPRVSVQVDSMAKQSAAQSAKAAHGEGQRGEKREAALAAGRRVPEAGEAESKAAVEAEDAGDLPGDDAPP